MQNQHKLDLLDNKVQEILKPMKTLIVNFAGYNEPKSKDYFYKLYEEMEKNIRKLLEENG